MALHLFIASARSGSSRLGQIMARLGMNFIPEPFHPDCVNWGFLGNSKLWASEALGVSVESITSDQIRDPASVLNICSYLHNSKNAFVVEIFPGHLPFDLIRRLARLYPVIVLQRRLIDQYISLQKAYAAPESARWMGVDTTGTHVRLRAKSFYDYVLSMREFYLGVARSITPRNSRASLIIDYEYFSFYSDASQVELVSLLLEKAGLSVSVHQSPSDPAVELHNLAFPEQLIRQDRSPSWWQKVANPREFVIELEKCNSFGAVEQCEAVNLGMRPLSSADIATLPFSITATCCA